jgi:hypothetical protein
MDEWFCIRHNLHPGPYSLEQMRDLIQSGELRGRDRVWKEGMPNWAPLQLVPELARYLPLEPPTHSPPGTSPRPHPPQPGPTEEPPHSPIFRDEREWDEDDGDVGPQRKRRKKRNRKKASVYDWGREEGNWLDWQFTDMSLLVLLLLPCIGCGIMSLAFGLAGTLACQDPRARRNAVALVGLSVLWIVVAAIFAIVAWSYNTGKFQ